jgi:hypothetical protein
VSRGAEARADAPCARSASLSGRMRTTTLMLLPLRRRVSGVQPPAGRVDRSQCPAACARRRDRACWALRRPLARARAWARGRGEARRSAEERPEARLPAPRRAAAKASGRQSEAPGSAHPPPTGAEAPRRLQAGGATGCTSGARRSCCGPLSRRRQKQIRAPVSWDSSCLQRKGHGEEKAPARGSER